MGLGLGLGLCGSRCRLPPSRRRPDPSPLTLPPHPHPTTTGPPLTLQARALLLIGAALGLLVSSGRATDPFAMLRAAFGGGGAEQQEAQWDFEEDELDDF